MIVLVPLLICIAGALIYALATNPKLAELGRISFGAGLLATLLFAAEHGVKILAM